MQNIFYLSLFSKQWSTTNWSGDSHKMKSIQSRAHIIIQWRTCLKHNLKSEGNWPVLWLLGVPHKIKNFLWRLLCGCLPTQHNLQAKLSWMCLLWDKYRERVAFFFLMWSCKKDLAWSKYMAYHRTKLGLSW